MRILVCYLLMLVFHCIAFAKAVRDTLYTSQHDKIILTYDVTTSGNDITLKMDQRPRIIPSDDLRKACKGDLSHLKVVMFDRVGTYGNYKWKGIAPKAFMVPSGMRYHKSEEGFYILGESAPLSFVKSSDEARYINIPLFIAIYESKQNYKLVGISTEQLRVQLVTPPKTPKVTKRQVLKGVETEQIEVLTTEEVVSTDDDVAKALGSIQMVHELLASETELPFSQTLQMEIYNLRQLKDRVKDKDVIERINEVLLEYNKREQELREAEKDAALSAEADEQALLAQQKAEDEARQKEAEEKARQQEEQQQKRTLWMIIGGVILGIIGFVGNAIFKHFRDVKNQKSIMEMQESLSKQAEHEATRRAKEIARNKAHQLANKGKTKMRASLNGNSNKKSNNKIKSI